jgi:cellulose synthase/poly-beta-1,6-N-acetylglucosamine synthase-like glycosyltransferase
MIHVGFFACRAQNCAFMVPCKSYLCASLNPGYSLQLLIVLFYGVVGIQSLYLIVFLATFLRRRVAKNISPVPVSVIVVAHDEEQNLKELVPDLLAQDYPEFEVIIVNDRSNDGTYDFLLEETKKNSRLRMVNVENVPAHVNGKKFGITLGIRAASHEWVLLTDADCRPAGKAWISGMSSQFTDETKFVLGFSPYQRRSGFLNLFIRFESLLTLIQYFSFAWLKNPYMGVGRNLAYRKSLFLEKKGFNQFLGVTGGDDDLFVNQHAKGADTLVAFTPETHVFSIPKATWVSFFNQKVRHLSVGKRYRLKHRILLGIFTLTWIITWFAGIPLLIIDITNWWIAAAPLALRAVLLMMLVNSAVKKAKLPFPVWAVPFLDFLYSIYYISTGLVALLTKKIRWRN